MIDVLQPPLDMSVVAPNVNTQEEVNEMSATTVLQHRYSAPTASLNTLRRARPRGVDLLIMRLSLAMLLWARHRADRGMLTYEEHTIRRANALAIERDQLKAAARIARVL